MNFLEFQAQGTGTINAPLAKGEVLDGSIGYGIRAAENSLRFKAGGVSALSANVVHGTTLIFSGVRRDAEDRAEYYTNGLLRGSRTDANLKFSDNSNPLHIGRDNSTGRHANVDFGEILVVGGALTAGDREQIEGYLAHKWNLDANLPAEHTYIEAPPLSGEAAANATLAGTATDAENDPLTFTWSVVSGPGNVVLSNPAAPDSSASFAVVGSYVLRLTVSDGLSSSFDEVTITVQAPADNTFTHWIAGFDVGALTGFNDDPDGDGIPNGIEAWFGTNPGEFTTGVLIDGTAGLVTTFTHSQNPEPPADLIGSYEWSPDLVNWYPHGGGPIDGPSVNFHAATEANLTTVTATASEEIPRMFLRVAVSQD